VSFGSFSVEDRIAHLRDLDLTDLRTCWNNEFGWIAPLKRRDVDVRIHNDGPSGDLFQRPLLPLDLVPSSRPREERGDVAHLADQPICESDCGSSAISWRQLASFYSAAADDWQNQDDE
jgi:hypothetical protein